MPAHLIQTPMQPPQSETELLQRLRALAGQCLGDLAVNYKLELPTTLTRAKGLIGQLVERVLGTTAGTKSAPDFEALGIELKTIPIDKFNQPRESTYVCAVPLLSKEFLTWRHSKVYQKLARVLWLPIEADSNIPIAQRRVGMGLLWSPSAEDEKILRQDWEELMQIVCLGEIDQITAAQGTFLQIRPKAANAQARRKAIGATGSMIETNPRGFYLRPSFTARILNTNYAG